MGPAREAIALVRGDVTAAVCYSRSRFFRAGLAHACGVVPHGTPYTCRSISREARMEVYRCSWALLK